MRSSAAACGVVVAVMMSLTSTSSWAQWGVGGVVVQGSRSADHARLVADGQGGFFAAWSDGRDYSGPYPHEDIFAQHLNHAGGLPVGCPSAGIPVCTNAFQKPGMPVVAADGSGGAFVAWLDGRDPATGWKVCTQCITGSGSLAVGWPSDGVVVGIGSLPSITADGAAGVFVVWSNQDGPDLYAQHLTATGTPAAGWPVGGLPIAVFPGDQSGPTVLPDGSGGIFAWWQDGRPGAVGIYMQHVLGDGSIASGWPVGGRVVQGDPNISMVGALGPDGYRGGGVLPDGAGGFYLGLKTWKLSMAWYDSGADSTLAILRLTGSGRASPGWSPAGTLVCAAAGMRKEAVLSADGGGRAFMAWDDYRGGPMSRMYAAEVFPDGSLAPGWAADGVPVSGYAGPQYTGGAVADGSGGVFVAGAFAGAHYADILVQHLDANGFGLPGWGPDGQAIGAEYNYGGHHILDIPGLVTDAAGGCIAEWNGPNPYQHYAQDIGGDGVVATALSLVSANAGPGQVSLLWQGDLAGRVTATVERRTESSDWTDLGPAIVEGDDRLRFQDREVAAGTRYGYRLSYAAGGAQQYSTVTWVEVPPSARFALAGLCPNPSSGSDLRVSFALPVASAAGLELLDLAGRRIAVRDMGGLGVGAHVESLLPAGRVRAGMYWLRLTQGNRSLVARAALTE